MTEPNPNAGSYEAPIVTSISLGFVSAFLIKGTDGLVLVDTGTPGSAPKIVNSIESLGFTPSQVKLIVLTHAHLDHLGSAHALKEITGAQVAIHHIEAGYLSQGTSTAVVPVTLVGHLFRLMTSLGPQTADGVQPDILIDDELDLRPFGVDGKVISTPGHTTGSVSIVLNGGSCLVGDLLMAFRKPAFPFFAQDKGQLRASLLKVIAAGANEVYPAHGHAYGIDQIRPLVA